MDSCDFSNSRSEKQGCNCLKQCISSSQDPSFGNDKPQILNDFVMISFGSECQAFTIHSVTHFLGGA